MTPRTRAETWASLRRALTGPNSISFTGWLGTLLPSTVLVIVQEATTPYPTVVLVLASAALQHASDGALAALALATQRVFPRLDRLIVRAALWTAIGVSRGLVGGVWAASFAGIAPDYGYRIAFWLLVTWVWMPTLAYTLAQLETRRNLLGRRDAEQRELLDAGKHDDVRQRDLRARLLDAVRAGIAPAVEEVRVRVLRLGPNLDPATTREIGTRIAGILDETSRIVQGSGRLPSGGIATPSSRAPLWATLAATQRRPFRAAGVMTIGMATLLLPEALRVGGPLDALVIAAGIAASVAVVLLAALIERRIPARTLRAQIALFAARVAAAGGAGAATILALGDASRTDVRIAAVMLPLVAGLAAAVVPTIVGIRRANDVVQRQIADLVAERRLLNRIAAADAERVRTQVAQLLHGPIQGRLSACAMALSFHAADPSPDPSRTAYITTSVLDHLDAVARDLEALAERVPEPVGPGEGGAA